MYDQAQKIIKKFGGVAALSRVLGLSKVAIYKWTYPKEKGGAEGLIPTRSLNLIFSVARQEGVIISPEDLIAKKVGVMTRGATHSATYRRKLKLLRQEAIRRKHEIE